MTIQPGKLFRLCQTLWIINCETLKDCLQKKGSVFHDLGLILAFLGTLVTVSQFKDFLNISANVWQAVFIVFLILSVIKLCRDLYFTFVVKSIKREDILKQLLDETRKKK